MSSPVAYEVNLETDEVIKCRIQPTVKKMRNSNDNDQRSMARWVKKDIIQGQSFRFEWK